MGRGSTTMKHICSWGRRNTLLWSHYKWNEKCLQEEVFQTEARTKIRREGGKYTQSRSKEMLD